MRYLYLHLTSLLAGILGDRGVRLGFRCPRARVLQEGCIYHGDFISENECLRLCQKFYANTEYEHIVEEICGDNLECECKTPPLIDQEGLGFIRSLSELEEYRATLYDKLGNYLMEWNQSQLDLHYNKQQIPDESSGLEQIRCGYRNELITMNECQELCLELQTSRGVLENPLSFCMPLSRCKCEEPDGERDFIFVDLDTLEAQHRNIMERNTANNVRYWLERHNQMDEAYDYIDSIQLIA